MNNNELANQEAKAINGVETEYMWPNVHTKSEDYYTPAVDIIENQDGITLYADMPGVNKENLDISLDKEILTIKGKVKIDVPKHGETLHVEFNAPMYSRSFTLSKELALEKIEAHMENGLLKLNIPKSEAVKPRKIEIN